MASPVIFKRKNPRPGHHARISDLDTDDVVTTTDNDGGSESPSTLATKLKNRVKKSRAKSRLSFGGADDEVEASEVFQVKKSNLSRKLALERKPSIPDLPSPQTGPKYDRAYLEELKASTPSARAPQWHADETYDADVSMMDADISMDFDTSFAAPETIIPSVSSVLAAKERRERMRKTSGVVTDEDFISLSLVHHDDGPSGPHPESRLMREEDELGEGEDEYAEYTSAQERIALGKKSRKTEASKRRDVMREMIEDAEELDEESTEWEQEILRRGGLSGTPDTAKSQTKLIYKPTPSACLCTNFLNEPHVLVSVPLATPLPTLGAAMARLTAQLSQLTTSHASNTNLMSSLAKEREEIDKREQEMRDLVERAETKRAWFSDFQDWVESVAGFLDEKYPLLERLEDEHISLLKERREMIDKRRHDDDDDDLTAFLGPLPLPPDAETVDDMGRDVSAKLAAERITRRTARAARHSQQQSTNTEEGYDTDAALPPHDAADYQEAISSLRRRRKDVLADVKAEEFRDPGKGRWKVWRERYSDSYVGAWGGLGVVSVWEFWARLELVGWDCIEDRRSLDTFKWYQGLFEYSRPGGVNAPDLGPDGDLVSSMVSTAIAPRICKLLEGGALDVYSSVHMRRVVDVVEEVEANVDAGNQKLLALQKCVVSAFERGVVDIEAHLARYEARLHAVPVFDPEAIPGRRRFMARRVKLVKNILMWRKYTGERFGVGVLIDRVVSGILFPVAEGGWDVGGRELVEEVVALLPNELVSGTMKSRLAMR
ncbi:hypothetical protein FISHEDRAFT_67141 [Fistulina hepatica ATCC 64428]|uniref:GCFC-domain-containing protein n=1 Tax=Fistulina hepatica ATCC 64428 TaxID=1128425 RepID=A0A0D7A5L8_9AGAR|nr:hypothetical protein FISHEDRAFT_67141 [Fistulina hepatica ATCC 64428]